MRNLKRELIRAKEEVKRIQVLTSSLSCVCVCACSEAKGDLGMGGLSSIHRLVHLPCPALTPILPNPPSTTITSRCPS